MSGTEEARPAEIRERIRAYVNGDPDTGALRAHIAARQPMAVGSPAFEQAIAVVRQYIEQIPATLDAVHAQSAAAPADDPVHLVVDAAERCFLERSHGGAALTGALEGAYAAFQVLILVDGMPAEFVALHQGVRNLLDQQAAADIDASAARALQQPVTTLAAASSRAGHGTEGPVLSALTMMAQRVADARSNLMLDPSAAQRAGNVDPTFGAEGFATFTAKGATPTAVAIQPNGMLLVAGTSTNDAGGKGMTVMRVDRAGRLDPRFAQTGSVRIDVGGHERADCVPVSIALQSDGAMLLAGWATTLPRGAFTFDDLVLARLTADGRFDTSFATGGWLQLNLDMSSKAAAALIEADGRIVVCGAVRERANGRWRICVLRVLKDGSMDRSFGSGGIAVIPGAADDETVAALRDPRDGGIVVLAKRTIGVDKSFVLARFTANGRPDAAFAVGGVLSLSVGSGDCVPCALALQPKDGKYVIAGYLEPREFIVLRVLPHGVPDADFGYGGSVTGHFPSFDSHPGSSSPLSSFGTALVVQDDEHILLCGSSTQKVRNAGYAAGMQALAADRVVAIARFDSSGQITADSFGVGGVAALYLGPGTDELNAAVLDGDRLVIAARSERGFALARVSCAQPNVSVAPGRLDPGFGTHGLVIDDRLVNPCALHLDSAGRIVVCGMEAGENGVPRRGIALARFARDGKRDTTFGEDGMARLATDVACLPFALLPWAGGYLAAARDAARRQLSLAYFPADGGPLRYVTLADPGVPFDARAVAIDTAGRLIVAGGAGNTFVVARYIFADDDGQLREQAFLDASFGRESAAPGVVLTPFVGTFASARAMSLLQDGRILVGGSVDVGSGDHPFDFALVRFREDGGIDTSFGRDGIRTLSLSGTDDTLHALLPFAAGHVLAGESLGARDEMKILVTPVDAEGATDRAFADGQAFFESSFSATARAIAVDDEGRIIVAGTADGDFLILRLHRGGTLDTSFAAQGLQRIPAGGGGAQFVGVAWMRGVGIVAAGKFPRGESDGLILFRLGE